MSWVIIAVAAGHVYASRIAWQTPEECQSFLIPSLNYLTVTSGDRDVKERCVDMDNASRFLILSSDEFILFPTIPATK